MEWVISYQVHKNIRNVLSIYSKYAKRSSYLFIQGRILKICGGCFGQSCAVSPMSKPHPLRGETEVGKDLHIYLNLREGKFHRA